VVRSCAHGREAERGPGPTGVLTFDGPAAHTAQTGRDGTLPVESEEAAVHVQGELNDSEAVLRVSGEIDVVVAPELREAIGRAFEYGAKTLVVDCAELTFIDSSGLGALVEGHTRAEMVEADFVLRNPSDFVMRLLRTTGLDTILHIVQA
jgi:anti-sigma B factor antagonist